MYMAFSIIVYREGTTFEKAMTFSVRLARCILVNALQSACRNQSLLPAGQLNQSLLLLQLHSVRNRCFWIQELFQPEPRRVDRSRTSIDEEVVEYAAK